MNDDRPIAEQLRTQRGPFTSEDLDEHGVFSVELWLSRRDQAWEKRHRDGWRLTSPRGAR